jgi:L-lactate utilization protein LutB
MLDPVKRAEKNLIKNGFKVKIFDSEEEAKDYLLKTISKGEEIGVEG